jgi:hypothetical protein
MRIPDRPNVRELKHLSPSLYEAALLCRARAAWAAFGDRDALPQHPRALLGTCLHSVMEDAHNGELAPGGDEARRVAARQMFDLRAKELYERAHPLLRAKFVTPDRLPYYNLFRERAALLALEAASRADLERPATTPRMTGLPRPGDSLVETRLTSPDGLLVGRPDYIDAAAGEVVDYKTGAGPDDGSAGLLNSEVRQLRLYVHLARARGLNVARGVVVRAAGGRVAIDVPEAEAEAEGQRARELLAAFNADAGKSFEELAEPSPNSCRYCPCIPLCEPFWEAVSPAWAEECGIHVEGTVSKVRRSVLQSTALLTLELDVRRGTAVAGSAAVQQIPEKWVSAGDSELPDPGALVRVVNCRPGDAAEGNLIIRADGMTTAVWIVRPPLGEIGRSGNELQGAESARG